MADINEKIQQYLQLRAYKQTAKKEFDKRMDRVTAAMDRLESDFLACLNDLHSDSVKSASGTAYKITRSSCSVKDRDVFLRYAVRSRNLELLDIRANKKVVKDVLTGGCEVPGVNFIEVIKIGVRAGGGNG